jgi:hypothetical protein
MLVEPLFHPTVGGIREDLMDRCPHCDKRMLALLGKTVRNEFGCLGGDKVDPLKAYAAKWAESPFSTKAASGSRTTPMAQASRR